MNTFEIQFIILLKNMITNYFVHKPNFLGAKQLNDLVFLILFLFDIFTAIFKEQCDMLFKEQG